MKHLLRAVMALTMACSGTVMAASVGPFADGTDHLGAGPVSRWIQTTWSGGGMHGNDLIHIKKDGDIDIYLQANLVVSTPSSGPALDATLTTIYGKQAPGAPLTGFDPTDGISFDSLEQHIGSSGQTFDAFAHETVAARDLSSRLAGVDLSSFDTDSATQFYEVFHTSLPLSEISAAVPEPDAMTLSLIALGCVGLSTRYARRIAPKG